MGIISEFKDFAVKGNVLDMAIGVVMGGAFGKIVSSVVDNLLSPIVAMVTGASLADSCKIILKAAALGADGKTVPEVAIKLGAILQVMIDFFFVALFVFLVVKAMNATKKKAAEAPPAAPPPPSAQEVLLGEIRDLLKNR